MERVDVDFLFARRQTVNLCSLRPSPRGYGPYFGGQGQGHALGEDMGRSQGASHRDDGGRKDGVRRREQAREGQKGQACETLGLALEH